LKGKVAAPQNVPVSYLAILLAGFLFPLLPAIVFSALFCLCETFQPRMDLPTRETSPKIQRHDSTLRCPSNNPLPPFAQPVFKSCLRFQMTTHSTVVPPPHQNRIRVPVVGPTISRSLFIRSRNLSSGTQLHPSSR